MSDFIWEKVDIKQTTRRDGEAFASIGQGRIALNANACDLLDNIYSYEWVDILHAKKGNNVAMIGLRFVKNKSNSSLKVVRRKYRGQIVDGISINSKPLVKKYFGETRETSTGRFAVKKIDDNTIAIDIQNAL